MKEKLKPVPDLWSESLRTRMAVPGVGIGNVRGAVLWDENELPMGK